MQFTEMTLNPFGETLLDLTIPNQLSLKTALVFRMVKELSTRQYLPAAAKHRAELCFEEAITNAMVHGNGLDPALQVHVILCADDERWGAIVEDQGSGFTPQDIPDGNDLQTVMSESGRGILLMDDYLDELLYSRKGNRVLMIRRRQSQPDEAEAPVADGAAEAPAPGDGAADPVTVLQDGDVDIVQVNASRLTDEAVTAMREAFGSTENSRLLLDLARVSYISSLGIGGLIHVRKLVTERKGRLVLTGLQPFVSETLSATRILTIFDVAPDRETGLSELRKDT
jgi:serine/threonine-protein kinase RsbW